MSTETVLVIPRVTAPEGDHAFLPDALWAQAALTRLVRADDGRPAALQAEVRVAWSARGLHALFICTDEHPLDGAFTDGPEYAEVVGMLLDPHGDGSHYLTVLVTPFGHVADARVVNPRHCSQGSRVDEETPCSGVRVRSWSRHQQWLVELAIPFSGLTATAQPPCNGERWAANFFRTDPRQLGEVDAWQPTYASPVDIHASDAFGVIEFCDSVSLAA